MKSLKDQAFLRENFNKNTAWCGRALLEIPAERFERFMGRKVDADSCWDWQGSLSPSGYGSFSVYGRSHRAIRISYIVNVGVIPEGMEIRHRCHNRRCVNPKHLLIGTHRQNIQDMMDARRHNPGKGERHFNATLNNEGVLAVRALLSLGWKREAVSKALRVHCTTVDRVASGRGWKHVK